MKAALYVRVSKADGTQTVDNQVPELEALAARRGLTIARTYEETQSAAKRRPVFQQMLDDASKRHFDTVLIVALDRFGRSVLGNMDDVRRLDRAGVGLISLREPWLDTTEGPLRSVLIALFSYVAEMERSNLRTRTVAGLERARREGLTLGRPKVSRVRLDEAAALVGGGSTVAAACVAAGVSEATFRRWRAAQKGSPDLRPPEAA